jgi:hypothetical protein
MLRDVTASGDRTHLANLQMLQNQLFHANTNLPNQMIKAQCNGEAPELFYLIYYPNINSRTT